jgi:serine/threonine protein kinase
MQTSLRCVIAVQIRRSAGIIVGGVVPQTEEQRAFGKYHLIASLGQGGMAKVYLALMAGPSGFHKLLVVKVMRHDLIAGSEDSIRMFWAEARLAARLVHQNIVHTYEVGEHDGRYFLAMEYLDGQPLSSILNRARGDGEIPVAEYLRIIAEVARALSYAHQLKGFQGEELHVVHRDVSPQNVIVTYDGQVKLLDFGIAKSTDAEQATQIGIVKGKLDYIAPEQLRGEHIDARADIFALGAMLWEVITGHRFAGGRKVNDVIKVQARLAGTERNVRALKPDVPHELESIVERALALDPAQRWQDAAAFADAIDEYLEFQNLRPSPRTLALHLKTLFSAERDEIHRQIDEQVQRTKQAALDGQSLGSAPPPIDVRRTPPGFGLYVSEAHLDDRSSIRNMGTMARSSAAAPQVAISRGALAWASGAFAVAAAAALAVLAWHNSPPPVSLADKPAAANATQTGAQSPSAVAVPEETHRPQSAAPIAAEAAANTVSISFIASPPETRVVVDDVVLALPFSGTFQRTKALHHLEATADGYRSVKQFVAFDRDKLIEITLDRQSVPHRNSGVFQRLIERANHTVQRHPERPAELPQPDLEPVKKPRPADSSRVLEGPNPYETD